MGNRDKGDNLRPNTNHNINIESKDLSLYHLKQSYKIEKSVNILFTPPPPTHIICGM